MHIYLFTRHEYDELLLIWCNTKSKNIRNRSIMIIKLTKTPTRVLTAENVSIFLCIIILKIWKKSVKKYLCESNHVFFVSDQRTNTEKKRLPGKYRQKEWKLSISAKKPRLFVQYHVCTSEYCVSCMVNTRCKRKNK